MTDIAIIDFAMGNLRSVYRALEHVAYGKSVAVTNDADVINAAERVVFPGQGAMGTLTRVIAESGLRPVLDDALANKPVLGICLGLQALYTHSDEDGGADGLGFFDGNVVRFELNGQTDEHGAPMKVPHMGWSQVEQRDHALWQGIENNARFYFVHSYYAPDTEEAVGVTEYGARFASAASRDNVFAVQFHPEKSQHDGLQLLTNFVNWKP